MTDSGAFWGAVVQIIPVLALAYIVEAAALRVPRRSELYRAMQSWESSSSDKQKETLRAGLDRVASMLPWIAGLLLNLLSVVLVAVWPIVRYAFDFTVRILLLVVTVLGLLAAEFIAWIVLSTGLWDNVVTRTIAISAAMLGLTLIVLVPASRGIASAYAALLEGTPTSPVEIGEPSSKAGQLDRTDDRTVARPSDETAEPD